jgi:hypothetical protein
MPTFVGLMIAMAEEFLDGRNMTLSNCPPAEIANVVGCSEPSVFAIQSYLRHFGPTARVRNSREVWRYSRSFHEQPRTCLLLHEAATQSF